MNDVETNDTETRDVHNLSAPAWYWVVAAMALLWNIMGCAILWSEVFAQEMMIESMTPEQQDWVRSTPMWLYIVFAVSVGTGLAGSICLFLRKNVAVSMFWISLIAVLIQMVYSMLIAGGLRVMGPSAAVMPTIVILLAVSWLCFSLFSKKKNWLS